MYRQCCRHGPHTPLAPAPSGLPYLIATQDRPLFNSPSTCTQSKTITCGQKRHAVEWLLILTKVCFQLPHPRLCSVGRCRKKKSAPWQRSCHPATSAKKVVSAPRIELGTFRLQLLLQSNVINQLHQAEEYDFLSRAWTCDGGYSAWRQYERSRSRCA